MEEGPLSNAAIGISDARTEKDHRIVDAATREHGELGPHGNALAGGLVGLGIPHDAADFGDLARGARIDRLHLHIGVDIGAVADGLGHERDEHRLLGVDRAAGPAVTGVRTLAHVAPEHGGFPAEFLRPVPQDAVVAIGKTQLHALDSKARFDALPVGHELVIFYVHAVMLVPPLDNVLWSTEAGGPVDHRGATHGPPLQNRDGEIGRGAVAAVLIEQRIHVRLVHVELFAGVVAALFEDDDALAGLGKTRGHVGAARARADHAHVALDFQIALDVGAGEDAHGVTSPADSSDCGCAAWALRAARASGREFSMASRCSCSSLARR